MKSKKLSRLLKIQAVVFMVVVAAGACSVGAFAYNCSRVRSDVLRMHVIANSDSDEDQALKLKVRDAVLERGAELFDGTVTADEAKAKIEPQKAEVVLGEGAGHNWWCVMFPPLCLPAAQDRGGNIDAFLDGDELKVVESSGRYEPRFKIVEIIEELREKTSPEN